VLETEMYVATWILTWWYSGRSLKQTFHLHLMMGVIMCTELSEKFYLVKYPS
jgi:hypothetical protein